jgi:hypothetical protein
VAHIDAPSGEHFLNHPKAQRKPEIEPDSISDHLGRKAMATIKRTTKQGHDRLSVTDGVNPRKNDGDIRRSKKKGPV